MSNTMAFTHTHIKQIFAEFRSLQKYRDKLSFYDTHFPIIPHHFPDFNNDLYSLFSEKNMNTLIKLLNEERKAPFKTIQKFTFDNTDYTFTLKPPYSNYSQFNDYILAQFITAPFSSAKRQIEQKANKLTVSELIDTAHEMARLYSINHKNYNILPTQIIQVFCKGLSDSSRRQKPVFTRKKKLIELYLYAQGMLFAQYRETLNSRSENGSSGKSRAFISPFHLPYHKYRS